MNETITVGEAIARTLEQYRVTTMYGIISIHNLPIADALGRRNQIHFVPTRGEAGAVTMADAHGRFSGLGVALTSTGAGAGNAVGAMIEALNACSPLLHITGQVEKAYLDAEVGFIHETKDQMGFLRACSKHAFRVNAAEHAIAIVHKAIQVAQTAPCGPVCIEIPIDIQNQLVPLTVLTPTSAPYQVPPVAKTIIADLAQQVKQAKRPVLWVGGGAKYCQTAVRQLADAGIAVVSTTHGRGILSDRHSRSLRAFHNSPAVEVLLAQSDLLLIAGSRLRSNETRTWSLTLPAKKIQIDLDPIAANRNYAVEQFILGDCQQVLGDLAAHFSANEKADKDWDHLIQQSVVQAEQTLREQSGPYAALCDALTVAATDSTILVRDITVSGSVWGNRLFRAYQPRHNIHSLAGAIGLGLPMAIGTALANPEQKIIGLVGDGGLTLGLGELAVMAQEQPNLMLLVMNDSGYGVMRGIQDKYFAGRQYYNELHTPSFTRLADAIGGIKSWYIDDANQFAEVITAAMGYQGPALVEVNMDEIGRLVFAGPPQKTLY